MTEKPVPVAEYAYDKLGRLRAEWDPRLEHPLKTAYGYDTEGHITALTRPGQESWALTYGTTVEDVSAGRLLKATQAPASAELWNGQIVANTEPPKLTGSAIIGSAMSVSSGAWSNGPIAYGYQWEDCNGSGKECKPIAGATNAGYTPVVTDNKHTLIVKVSAVNGGGTATVSTTASAVVTGATPIYSSEFGSKGAGSGQFSYPEAIATDPSGNDRPPFGGPGLMRVLVLVGLACGLWWLSIPPRTRRG
jgi:RHS Repeat